MSVRRFLLPAAAVLVATMVAAGCGGTGSSEPVATTKVSMAKSYRFDPKTIEIKAGDTVTWTNNDNFTHTVRSTARKTTRSAAATASRSSSTNPAPTTMSARCTATTCTER
jgi:plastocyanin